MNNLFTKWEEEGPETTSTDLEAEINEADNNLFPLLLNTAAAMENSCSFLALYEKKSRENMILENNGFQRNFFTKYGCAPELFRPWVSQWRKTEK